MKSEQQLREYLKEVQKQVIEEEKAEHRYLTIIGKIIISTIMYVLEDDSLDINRLVDEMEV